MCKPASDAGTANVALKEPGEFVVMEDGAVVSVVPSYVRVIADELAKPEPVTVTEIGRASCRERVYGRV